MGKSLEYRYDNDPRNVAKARSAIATFAQECGFTTNCIDEIRLAAGEALSNASEHGCCEDHGHFSIRCIFSGGELTIEISDDGSGFRTMPVESELALPDARGRGFGLFLMRRFMDSVSFDESESRVRLTRKVRC